MRVKIFLTIIAIVAIGVIVNTLVNSRAECKRSYNFEITKIKVSPSGTLRVFDGKSEVQLWDFRISRSSNIAVGDLFVKKPCSDTITIYRKDTEGKYRIFLEEPATSLISYRWFNN